MKEISNIGKEMLAFQEKLAREYGYKPIEYNLFLGDVRQKYKNALPDWCVLNGNSNCPLFSFDGTRICSGYNRIVIGDYGAYIEITPEQIIKENIHCQPGQEWRSSDVSYAQNVKYLWLTAKDKSNCKIYFQKNKVNYADYVPGMYYISPYEVSNILTLEKKIVNAEQNKIIYNENKQNNLFKKHREK